MGFIWVKGLEEIESFIVLIGRLKNSGFPVKTLKRGEVRWVYTML